MKTVVLSGILGQGASYAADLYLEKGYNVIGLHRRSSSPDLSNIKHIIDHPNFTLREADICDQTSISNVISEFKPYAFLNFAAQSHVGTSYNQPLVTAQVDYLAVVNILECIRLLSPSTKFWQANTSERMGNGKYETQDENTPPSPISPYAVAKTASEYLIKSYVETYGLHASYSIMFNYESPRRSRAFVTRKITDYIGKAFNKVEKYVLENIQNNTFISVQSSFEACIQNGTIKPLKLGNLDTYRSWTHCKDTIRGVYAQIELEKPDVFVLGREETYSIKDFLTEAFSVIGVGDWSNFIIQDKEFMRPSDVKILKPTCTKAKNILGWKPEISFKDLVKEMVEFDIELNSK